MKVPAGVLQVGMAIRKKYKADESELKTVEDIRHQRREALKQVESVDDILAAEAKQEQRRKPAAVRKPRQAKSLKRPVVADLPPEPVTAASEQTPEPKPVIIKAACPVTYGLPSDDRPFGDTPPRDVPRADLTAWALNIIRTEGPQSTNGLLARAFGNLSPDDLRAMRQRIPKWLTAECQYMDPPLTMRRWRSTQGGEKRDNLFGFWTPEQLDKEARSRRSPVDLSEVISRLDTLCQELATVRSVQQEILHRQASIREGLAAALEKLTWNGEA